MPTFITNRKKVLEQYNSLKSLGLRVSYSKKTNETVWKILEKETDSEVACHSEESVMDVKDKSKVWYFTLATSEQTFKELLKMGVNKFIIDNPQDLDTLLMSIGNKKVDVLLRMKMKEHTIFTGKYFVFGMDSAFVNDKLLELRKNKSIRHLGVHFHRKSQNVTEWSLKTELEDALRPEVLEVIDILDIGGGFPVNYKSSHDKAIDRIFEKVKELREWLPKHIQLIAEPGRFIAGPSSRLECEIIAIHDKNIFVDWSIYAGAVDTVLTNVKLLVEGELDEGPKYTIKGRTPCSLDILRYDVRLKDPSIGDKITFLNAGAYAYMTDFCKLPNVEIVVE